MTGFLGLLALTMIVSGWVGYKLAEYFVPDDRDRLDNFLP